ncbi:winged helix DNA-binding protein [Anoxybacillus rupiensis]|uniref:Winged helix DNA-binding protein n=1 Tax=Anoxybacteroides rupiense TaxID=311460 RepID=A0ABD5IW50_9BACL|nr:winged helix DNA-binding protein [Anoxybacillus rupiensis]
MIHIPLEEILKNLNEISWDILDILKDQSLNFVDIRSRLSLSQEKAYKELARLEGACLIQSKQNTKDQRSKIYSLTPYGESVFEFKNK